MIWNNEVLFLDVPGTTPAAVRDLLLKRLDRPVSFTSPERGDDPQRARHRVGTGSETLVDAMSRLSYAGLDLEDFTSIVVVLRDPYELELARYLDLANGDRSHDPLAAVARSSDFPTYLRKLADRPLPNLERHFTIDGMTPPNLRVARYERLADDLERHLTPHLAAGVGSKTIRAACATRPVDLAAHYDPECEAIVHERHRWFFDTGHVVRRPDVGSPVGTIDADPPAPTRTIQDTTVTPSRRLAPPVFVMMRTPLWGREGSDLGSYLAALFDVEDLGTSRVLGIEFNTDLLLGIADGTTPIGDYVALESDPVVAAYFAGHLDEHAAEVVLADLAADDDPLATIDESFDLAVVRTHAHLLDETRLKRLLTSVRPAMFDDGQLVFSAFLGEPTSTGEAAIDRIAEQIDLTDLGDYGEFEWKLGNVPIYSRHRLSTILTECGWDLREVREPRRTFQHHFRCTVRTDD